MKEITTILAAICIIFTLAYGGFKVDRWYKYKFGYQSKVEEQLQPLGDRLGNVEKRLSVIEKQLGITTITNK